VVEPRPPNKPVGLLGAGVVDPGAAEDVGGFSPSPAPVDAPNAKPPCCCVGVPDVALPNALPPPPAVVVAGFWKLNPTAELAGVFVLPKRLGVVAPEPGVLGVGSAPNNGFCC
jgi:hypothetical protein